MATTEPCYIIHKRPFKESSLLVDVMGRQSGLIRLIARSCRRPKTKALLQPFLPLHATWTTKSSLGSLNSYETLGPAIALKGELLYCGFYINELIFKLLPYTEGHPPVFDAYERCLQEMHRNTALSLRRFEFSFLTELGYGFPETFPENETLMFRQDGFIGVNNQHPLGIPKAHILNIKNLHFPDQAHLNSAKKLARSMIQTILGDAVITSRSLW